MSLKDQMKFKTIAGQPCPDEETCDYSHPLRVWASMAFQPRDYSPSLIFRLKIPLKGLLIPRKAHLHREASYEPASTAQPIAQRNITVLQRFKSFAQFIPQLKHVGFPADFGKLFCFFFIPQLLKMADLWTTLFLMRYPLFAYETNPVGVWLLSLNLPLTILLLSSATLVASYGLYHLWNKYEDSLTDFHKVINLAGVCLGFGLLLFPVLNNVALISRLSNYRLFM